MIHNNKLQGRQVYMFIYYRVSRRQIYSVSLEGVDFELVTMYPNCFMFAFFSLSLSLELSPEFHGKLAPRMVIVQTFNCTPLIHKVSVCF